MRKTVRMESARKRAGGIIRSRRQQLGFTSQKTLAAAGNMGVRQVAAAELGEYVGPKTLRRLEVALHWPEGHLDAILQGAEADMSQPAMAGSRVEEPVYDRRTGEVNRKAGIRHLIVLATEARRDGEDAEADELIDQVMVLIDDYAARAVDESHRVS